MGKKERAHDVSLTNGRVRDAHTHAARTGGVRLLRVALQSPGYRLVRLGNLGARLRVAVGKVDELHHVGPGPTPSREHYLNSTTRGRWGERPPVAA